MSQESKFDSFKSAIARIYSKNGTVVGAGFLVSPSWLITCAHVVTSALGLPQNVSESPRETITLNFPLSDHKRESFEANVIWWRPVSPGQVGEDIAVLELKPNFSVWFPAAVKLAADQGQWDAHIRMFGFPKDFDNGIWVTGKLRDEDGAGLVQMDAIAAEGGRSVEKGFSGAPIWDEALQAVVGMAIAAEKRRDAVTAAFMTPQSTLSEYALAPLEQKRLLGLLESATSNAEAIIRHVHHQLQPKDWKPGQHQPTNPEEILQDLADMPEQAECQPLHLLVAAFLISDQIDNDAKQPLRNWLESQGGDIPELLDFFSKLPIPSSAAEAAPAKPYLLILVRPTRPKTEKYFVDGWFLAESRRASASYCPSRKRLDLPAPESKDEIGDTHKRTFKIPQIPVLVEKFLDQIGGTGVDTTALTVEVFVPIELLDQAVHEWSIADQFGGDNLLCLECQQVMLRSYERLARNYRPKGLWLKKWQYVETLWKEAAQGLFIPFDKTKSQALRKAEAIAVKLPDGNVTTEKGGPLALVLGNAIPIALWLGHTVESVEEFEDLLNCCLQTVLDNVSQKRREAYDDGDENHLGRQLSLIWENPHRVPPDIDYSI